MATVLEVTVKNSLCTGCGMCAAICPRGLLSMAWNADGEWNPVIQSQCEHECGMCTNVCPSLTTKHTDEDAIGSEIYGAVHGIQHRPETGYYLACGAGGVSDPDRRSACASGGLASWFLEQLVRKEIVDAVVCVHHTYDGEKLFGYTIASTVEDIRKSRGSAYYPTEISAVVRYILEHEGKYAVIGLPCTIKALRLAQRKNKLLRERILVIVGLTCGRMKNAHYTDYVAYLSGLNEKLHCVRYRNTDLSHSPLPHGYQFYGENGTHPTIKHKIGTLIYHSGLFGLSACKYCDDMMAECADITFMDAWLPEYTRTEPRGTNIFVTRSPLACTLLEEGNLSGELSIHPLPIEKVIASQGGLIRRKRIHYLLTLRKKAGLYVPFRRFDDASIQLSWLERYQARRYVYLEEAGKKKWQNVEGDCKKFRRWVMLQRLISLPYSVAGMGYRILKNQVIRRFSP